EVGNVAFLNLTRDTCGIRLMRKTPAECGSRTAPQPFISSLWRITTEKAKMTSNLLAYSPRGITSRSSLPKAREQIQKNCKDQGKQSNVERKQNSDVGRSTMNGVSRASLTTTDHHR